MNMRIDIYHHFESGSQVLTLLNTLNSKLDQLTEGQTTMARTLEETLVQVTAAKTKVEGLIVYTAGIKAQLDAVLAGVLTPAQQAQVDAIFDEAKAAADETDAALGANVPTP